ncbi:porin [Variovorax sp. AFSI2.2]|uniref:porin n=1 Tax=Variovorax sp. AFSI2.2 TaxID=3384160 RepID=UPI003EBB34AA
MAALAVAGVASAQSSVTLFGVVDASISHYETSSRSLITGSSFKQSQTALANSGYNSSRLGFRGTEDLGGGLAASFWLESPMSNDDGASSTGISFSRRSTVSLSGGFGEVRLGRDYTPTFWNDTVFDPFGTNGVGTNVINSSHSAILTGLGLPSDSNYVRANNTIGYFLPPNLGGFYGQVQYGLHENVKTSGVQVSKTGRYVGGRVGYANGPLDVGLAYGKSDVFNNGAGTGIDARTLNLGASYDFGVVKLFTELSRVTNEFYASQLGSEKIGLNGFLIGATAPVGAGLIRVAYSQAKANFDGNDDPRSRKFAIGYVHNLSKRTALYTTVARVANKNGAPITVGGAPRFSTAAGYEPRNSTGYDFGIRHAF